MASCSDLLQVKAKKKEAAAEKKILLSIAPRGKKKAVTVVQGLKTCGRTVSRFVNNIYYFILFSLFKGNHEHVFTIFCVCFWFVS